MITKDQKDWLLDLQHQLETQDNLHTANPVYVVYEMEQIPTDDDFETSGHWYNVEAINEDQPYESEEEAIKAIEAYNESNEDDEDFSPLDPDIDIEAIPYVEKPRFLSACLTMQAAREFIERRSYAYHKAYVYVESLYYNYEMRMLLGVLKNLDVKDLPTND